jgi:F-type H+-transporting ATPase subunit epsilon
MLLDVVVMNPRDILFEGKAKSVIVPGEQGTFEIMPFHKRILSRLVSGRIYVDESSFSIYRGIIKVNQNTVTIVAEDKP